MISLLMHSNTAHLSEWAHNLQFRASTMPKNTFSFPVTGTIQYNTLITLQLKCDRSLLMTHEWQTLKAGSSSENKNQDEELLKTLVKCHK
jgi:hypothetical protein